MTMGPRYYSCQNLCVARICLISLLLTTHPVAPAGTRPSSLLYLYAISLLHAGAKSLVAPSTCCRPVWQGSRGGLEAWLRALARSTATTRNGERQDGQKRVVPRAMSVYSALSAFEFELHESTTTSRSATLRPPLQHSLLQPSPAAGRCCHDLARLLNVLHGRPAAEE